MRAKLMYLVLSAGICFFGCSHTLPSMLWSSKSMALFTAGDSAAPNKILILGGSTNFKDTIVQKVIDSLKSGSVFIRVSRLKDLKTTSATDWTAIVLFNTCVAWHMENRVQDFIADNPTYKSIVVVTTSGDKKGCWGPSRKLPDNIDAVSSASEPGKLNTVVDEILKNVRKHLK